MTRTGKVMLTAIGVFVLHFAYMFFRHGHSPNWIACKSYMWIFKDSARKNIYFIPENLTTVCFSYSKKRDVYNGFPYFDEQTGARYGIFVWEFKDMSNFDLNKISINQNVPLNSLKIWSGEILGDPKDTMPVNIKYGFEFKHNLNVNLNEYSKIAGTFSGKNYKGFYGTIDQMSFSDERGRHQIFFGGNHATSLWENWSPKEHEVSYTPTVFLLYKGHGSFYVIMINSKWSFKDASIIKILNLD
jgi:hypothetical protein